MSKVLIIGTSGSGKSYLSSKLKELGLNSYDGDLIKGLSTWVDKNGTKVNFPENADKQFFENHQFIWDLNFLEGYLNDKHDIYIFGLSGNVFEVIDLFDKVFYLFIDSKVLEKRLSDSKRENPMGKTDEQRKVIIEGKEILDQKARELNLHFLDVTKTPEQIKAEIS